MRRILLLLLTAMLTVAAIGCGGDHERGKNRDKDVKPREAPTVTNDKK
jgi:hypothetical protein